jgi:hypothetical protein
MDGMKAFRRHLSYANVAATIALFVALGGTSYAALSLPAGSVGTKQLKNGAVTRAKLARGVVAVAAGPQGLPGPQGATGPQGGPGPAGANLTPTAPEPWHEVATSGNPGFEKCFGATAWQNSRPGTDATAAYYRDPLGVVHLKGTVKCPGATPVGSYFIWKLPPGYSPEHLQWFTVSADNGPATVVAENFGPFSALVYVNGKPGPDGLVSLDGISWRCTPSGADGCP